MHFELSYRFPTEQGSETLLSPSTLRFGSQREIEQQLQRAGLSIQNLWGDWDRSAFAPQSSPEMIFEVTQS